MVLALVDDLLFRSKIEVAAARSGMPVTVAATAEAFDRALARQPWGCVVVDLELSAGDALARVASARRAAPAAAIVGFCSHVDTVLQDQAKRAGCTTVLPRSAFVRQLPELLRSC